MTVPHTVAALGRRDFFRIAGAGALALGSSSLLAACGSSTTALSDIGDGTFAPVDLQLLWIKNVEFAGEYFAIEKGYYTAAGIKGMSTSNLLASSGSTTAEDVVASGQALIGLSTPSATAPAILKGAPLVTIASTYQKNPYCLLSLKERTPITSIEELKGKKVGVQAGANQVIWEGFLSANGLDTSDVTSIPTQYSIAPLESGKYDAHVAYLTNEPNLAETNGFTPVTLGFADHGLQFVSNTYIVTRDTLAGRRDVLKAFLTAEIKGWIDAVKNPEQSASYAVKKYGADQNLDITEQIAEAKAQNGLIVSDETNANGLLTISDSLKEQNIRALADMGTKITADRLFDTSLLDEIYQENPELIVTLPVTKE